MLCRALNRGAARAVGSGSTSNPVHGSGDGCVVPKIVLCEKVFSVLLV